MSLDDFFNAVQGKKPIDFSQGKVEITKTEYKSQNEIARNFFSGVRQEPSSKHVKRSYDELGQIAYVTIFPTSAEAQELVDLRDKADHARRNRKRNEQKYYLELREQKVKQFFGKYGIKPEEETIAGFQYSEIPGGMAMGMGD